MNAKKLLALPLAAAFGVCLATCAPTDRPRPKEDSRPGKGGDGPAEWIAKVPKAVPKDQPQIRIESAIHNIRQRDLLTTNGFWTVFHGILGLGPSVTLRDLETGQRFNAIDYICEGRELRGMDFYPTKHGLDVRTWVGSGVGQGHQDQFVAEMAQWGMPADKMFVVLGKDYTFLDFVHHSQMNARVTAKQELSWTIVIVGQYLGTDLSWTNAHGEKLHFEDLIRYELDQPVENAACGGTHRLFGLAWVHHLHLQRGGKTEGVWKEIADKTMKYRDLAKKHQNADGTFSTSFFTGPGNDANKQQRINTTGHMLEWLALALPVEELKEEWVQRAANALAMLLIDLQNTSIDSGPLYHAAHGLLIYYARVYDRQTLGPPELLIPLPPEWEAGKGK
jgi:hypothetical protein